MNDGRDWPVAAVTRIFPQMMASSYQIYASAKEYASMGGGSDPVPVEGKVHGASNGWLLLQLQADATFFAIQQECLAQVPSLDDIVRITPYVRKDFKGERLKEDSSLVLQSSTFGFARPIAKIPFAASCNSNRHLLDLIDQIEKRLAPDGFRTIAQMIVDAGAAGHLVGARDPVEAEERIIPPALQFRVDNEKFKGMLNIVFDVSVNSYRVQLVESGSWRIEREVEYVFLSSLGNVVAQLIDDGKWQLAKVEILKPARRRRSQVA